MGDRAIEYNGNQNTAPDIDINWSESTSKQKSSTESNQPYLVFDDPYPGQTGKQANDNTLSTAAGESSSASEMSSIYQGAYMRAALGLEQDAFQGEVDALLEHYNGAPPPGLLGLPADASAREIDQAVLNKMKDNVGLPSTATSQELLERLAAYDRLAAIDETAADRRADAGLPPSATEDEVSAVNNAYKDASRRAAAGLSQLEPASLVDKKERELDSKERLEILGLPEHASAVERRNALDAKIKENIGLPGNATRTEMLQRLMKYNEVGAMNPTDAYLRAQYGLDPSASIMDVLHAQKSLEQSRQKVALGLPLTASQEQVQAASKMTDQAERSSNLGLSLEASGKEYGDAMDAGIKRELGLPKEATRVEMLQRLLAFENLAQTNPEAAFMRVRLGLSMSASFEEVREAMARRIRPDD